MPPPNPPSPEAKICRECRYNYPDGFCEAHVILCPRHAAVDELRRIVEWAANIIDPESEDVDYNDLACDAVELAFAARAALEKSAEARK